MIKKSRIIKFLIFISVSLILLFAALLISLKLRFQSKGFDLDGKNYHVKESGNVIKNFYNGQIVIDSSVGPGLVILKGCHDISLEVQSNAYLLLDNRTSVKNLIIKSNGLVDSLESFLYEEKGKILMDSERRPKVERIEVYRGFSPVIKNVDYNTKSINFSGTKTDYEKNLEVTQDTSFEGLGVRLLLENIPSSSQNLSVVLVEKGKEKQVDWFSAKEDRSRFYSGFYDYRFLDAGKKYTFRLYYRDENGNEVGKAQVEVIPSKGRELKFDPSNAKLTIDEKTGIVSWESIPKAEMPEGTLLVYDLISYGANKSWNHVGQFVKSPVSYDSINIYKDMKIYNPENLYNDRAFISVFLSYETYRWIILETGQFDVNF